MSTWGACTAHGALQIRGTDELSVSPAAEKFWQELPHCCWRRQRNVQGRGGERQGECQGGGVRRSCWRRGKGRNGTTVDTEGHLAALGAVAKVSSRRASCRLQSYVMFLWHESVYWHKHAAVSCHPLLLTELYSCSAGLSQSCSSVKKAKVRIRSSLQTYIRAKIRFDCGTWVYLNALPAFQLQFMESETQKGTMLSRTAHFCCSHAWFICMHENIEVFGKLCLKGNMGKSSV